jgi:UDP-N-acetylglucosamine--dolichyl-phosphate N-acetylglucosaminephosphotransferase
MHFPNPILFIPLLVGFFVTFLVLPGWLKKTKKLGLVGRDMNKYRKTEIAESGGITVIAGFILGAFVYIAVKTFYFSSKDNMVEIFALISVTLILAFVGMIDDLFGWKKGLSRKFRLFLVLLAAVPLIVINAGGGSIDLPFLGITNLGLIYTLILIPVGVVGATVTFNFLAGYNGLEAGQGMLILFALSLITYLNQDRWLSLLCLCMVFALAAFWLFNKYPAKVFPGDIMTYSVGGLIAIVAIFGGIEKIAVFFFLPYILETFLKLRGKLNKQSFAKPKKDGSIDLPYDKVYSLCHIAILLLKKYKKNRRAREEEVVYLIHAFQIIIILVGFLVWVF